MIFSRGLPVDVGVVKTSRGLIIYFLLKFYTTSIHIETNGKILRHCHIFRITICKSELISMFMHRSDALRVLFRITKRYHKLSSNKCLILL